MKINYQSNLFYRIYLAGFLIILSLPLLNWPIYFSPPNWAKTLVFQMVFAILLFIFLCHLLWERNSAIFDRVKRITKENLVFWLLVLLFATHFLSTIFSVDFHYSFFGSPYRGGGFISYGFYILFAIATFLIIKKNDWKKLWNVAIGVGVIVCILALFSRFGLFSNFLITRIDNLSSTIGGPNTLGLYVMLLVFPALSFGLQVKNNIKRGLYLITSALFSFIVLLTISQGAYLGLAMGAIYFLIFFPTKSFTEKTRRKIFYGKIAIVTVAALLFFSAIIIKSNPDYTLNDHYLFKQLTTWKVDKSRLATWQVSFDAFLDKPLLGYGPENFSIGFDRNYDPTLSSIQMDEATPASWWDKAHNFALNLLVETGIIGFIPFILLFGLVFWQLHKITHKKIDNTKQLVYDPPNPIITHGLQAAFIAYFTNLMFNFENFSSYILAFLIVGYAMSFTIPETPKTAFKDTQHSNLQRVQWLFVRNKKVRLLNTSATKLPFKKCFFDRVIAVEVIEHIHDRKKPLEEIFRVLKPKGFAVITVPNKNYPFLWDPINWSLETFFQTHFRSDFWTLAGIWADHCRIYSKEELKEDLINVGFKIEKMWFLTKYCFPFSNLIYYGIGMKLVEHGLFSGFNRFSSNSRPSIVNRILLWPIRAIDKLNRKNRISSKSVNIAVKAQKP